MAGMPRRTRLEFAGAVYHVLDRGDRREAIFRDDRDRETFLATLGAACARTGWRVHAYVLTGNHSHLLCRPPSPVARLSTARAAALRRAAARVDRALSSREPPRDGIPRSRCARSSRCHAIGASLRRDGQEFAHLHGNGLLDVKLTREGAAELVSTGRAAPHHLFGPSAWVSFWLRSRHDLDRALALIRPPHSPAPIRD